MWIKMFSLLKVQLLDWKHVMEKEATLLFFRPICVICDSTYATIKQAQQCQKGKYQMVGQSGLCSG